MSLPFRFALAAVLCLGLTACPQKPPTPKVATRTVPEGASLLFDVNFSAPEQAVGSRLKFIDAGIVHPFPSKLPSGLFFGQPLVVEKLCGLDDQPVRLTPQTGEQSIEGIEFLLDQRYVHYHLELDLCIERLDPAMLRSQAMQVAVFLDISDAHALGFVSGGEIVRIDPSVEPETIEKPKTVGAFVLGKPMHLVFDIDWGTETIRMEVDGKVLHEGPLPPDLPRAVRVVVRGNPSTVAAFDNFWLWAERNRIPAGIEVEQPVAGPEIPPVPGYEPK